MLEVVRAREGRRLVDDRVGAGGGHGAEHRIRIE
jgi:hypothetical protein